MKHLKTFESFDSSNVGTNEGWFNKTTDEKLKKAPEAFLAKLSEIEKVVAENKDIIFNKEGIIEQAYDNDFIGDLVIRKYAATNKADVKAGAKDTGPRRVVVYINGKTLMNKLAAGSGVSTYGESVKNKFK